jgi:hypothetical protein
MDHHDLSFMVEQVIDDALLRDVTTFKMYDYLKSNSTSGTQVNKFIESSTVSSLTTTIADLKIYLEGGQDSNHKQIREGYGHLGKPRARKIMGYFNSILKETMQYAANRKPGRKRKITDK